MDCTSKISIPKLSENSPFKFSNNNHDDRNIYQVTFAFIENPGNILKNTVILTYDELRFMFIKNRLHQ